MTHDVSREARDARGRWAKTPGEGAFSDWNVVDQKNLKPPTPPFPALPAQIDALLKRMIALPNREYHGTGVGETIAAPGDTLLTVGRKMLWELRRTPPEQLKEDLKNNVIDIAPWDYQSKYGGSLDDALDLLVQRAQEKLTAPSIEKRFRAKIDAGIQVQQPKNLRWQSVSQVANATNQDISTLTGQYAERIRPYVGGLSYFPYDLFDVARENFNTSAPGSSEWEQKTLKMWRKMVSERQGRDAFHQGKEQYDDKGLVAGYIGDGPYDSLPLDERMEYLAQELHAWGQRADEQIQFLQQAYRKRYRSIIDAAQKAYRDAYSEGATTAGNWVKMLTAKYAVNDDAAKLVTPAWIVDKAVVGDDYPVVLDAFRALPLSDAVREKLSKQTTSVKVESDPQKLYGGSRASYSLFRGITLAPSDESEVVDHEYGHHIEHVLNLGPALKQWVIDRATYMPVRMGQPYGNSEMAYPDKFITKYVGKSYPDASTEVLSMGIQAALTHPDDFMKVDPEHFFLTMGVLLGLGETMNTADPVFPRPTEKSEDVKKPGSRGGHPWLDEHGHWRYDQQPAPEFGKTLEETIHNYRLAQRRALQRKDKTAAKQYDAYASLAEAAAYKPYALNSYQEMATDPVEGYNLPKQDVATFVATLRKQPRSPLPDTILSPAAKATVVRAIKAIKDRPIEHLVVVDPSSGRVLDALKGSPSQVGRHGSRPYYGTIHIHNHPAELYAKNEPTVSFSRDDILAAAKRGAAMIMAVGRDGKVYIMQPPQGRGWNTSFYMDKILPAWEQADAELESTKGSDYKEGGLADSVDRTWKMVAAKTGIRYTVTSLSALEQDAAMAQTAQVTSPAPVSAWKPLMTEQEAEQWSAHSAYKQPVWHVTTPEAAKEIREHGFTLGNEVSFGSEFGAGIYLATDDATKKYYEDRIRERGQEPVVLEGRVNVHHVLKLNMTKMPSADDWDNSGISGVAKQLPGGRKRFTQECQKYYQQWNEKVYAKVEEKYPMGSVSKQRPGEEETAWRERLNKYREKREQYQQYLTRKFHMVGWNDSAYVEAKVIRDMLLQAGYDAVYVQMRPEDYDTGDWAMETIGGSQIMVTDPDDVTVAAKSFDFRHPSKKLQFLLMFLADQYATVDNVDQRPLARSFGAWLWRHGRDLVKAVADQPASGADQPASQVGQSGGDQPVKSQMHDPIPAGSRWITVHPNGSDEPGHPVLIMPAHGRKNVWHIIGGAGGRLTHMEIHLNSPEEWKQHAIERAKARKEQEVQAGVTPDNKAALKRAKEESQRLYVKRVAERMGWQDYSDKTADDFLAQAKGNKTQAALLAHQYLRSYVSKANEAMKNLRTRLAVDKDAFAGANLRLASGDTDPYRADENDLIPGDISQRLTESQNLGNHEAVGYYQQALDALKGGDTEAAKTYLTAGNKAAGIRGLTVQDVLPQENVQQPTGAETAGKQAKEQIQASGALAPEALQQRIDAATALAKSGNEADKYTSQLELDALKQAQEQAGGDPTKTDMKGAAKAYLQAEKFRAIREKLKGDTGKFQAWKGMREQAIANAAGVRALRNQGKFGADGVDPDVADMAAARDLLAAKVLYDNRMRQIKQAQQSLDPQLMHTVVQDKDVLESDATWDDVYNQAQKQAQADIEQAKETATAADLDVATDNPTNFLRAVGEGEPVDQQHIQRYIHFGQQSALDVIGENAGGAPLLPVTAYRALGVKGASKLMANYLAATRKPEEFNALKEGIGNYHAAREFDVANGALVAANAVLAAAKEYKREEDANVDNLYEAAKYNKLRLEAVDHALATIGTAYGELNATAEMNYALMAAKPGAQNLVIDGEGRDAGQLVALAHALNLDPADYRLVDQQKAKGGTAQPRGLELTTSGVGKLFHEATPAQKDRRARLMSIRAGDQDDLMPDGSKATNGWLPPYFANWPATLRNTQTAPVAKDEQTLDKQTLQGNPQETLKAVAYALGEQPFATVAFKDNLDADDIKLLQAFYASRRGIPVEQPKENQEYVPESSAPETDIFGNPILAKTAAGKASDDKASVAWRDLVHRVGAQQALQVVQSAIKSDFLTGFVPVYNTMTGQNLQIGQEKLGPKSDYARTTIGPQAEQQLTDLVQKMAWRYPKAQGDAGNAIPGVNMSGRFVKQQRVIKSLEASGGLNGKEGGRLGGFLGTGSGKSAVSVGSFTNLLAQGKAKQAIYAVPSAVLGQFGSVMNGFIDPNAPLKWYADPASTSTTRAKVMADPNMHVVTMTHESLRDDTLKALGRLWNVPPRQAAKQFQGMTRKQRASAVKQAFTKEGWGNRFDFFSVDEGHQALNRKGKANSILANVIDAVSDNSKYYLPLTGTPTRNDPSEVYDWLTKLRPDEYPPDKMQSFLARHQLLGSEVARLEAAKAADVAAGKSAQRNWTSNAAAEALQDELGENFYSSSAPIKAPVSYQNVKVALKDQPDEAAPKTDGTLPSLMQAGLQKSAYERVGQIEQAIKAAAYKQDWKQVAAGIRELTTATYKANNGKTVTRNAYTLANGQQITPGSPEEEAATKRLVTATAMMRDAAYNRVLHTMPDGNAKTKALMSILDDMGKQYAADDNQPRDAAGNPVTGDQRVKGKPVIIFTRSLDAVDNLVSTLKAHGYNALGISGRDSGADKIRKKELFQPSGKTKPRVNVLVMSDAMSAGVDLPRAEAVIHYDTGDTAKVMEQRSARAIRLSTKHPVSVYSLISDTPYEQRRVDRVARKGTLGDVVQNPAETLDDTGLGWYINQQRIAQARQQHENPTPTRPEDSLPAQGLAQAKKSDYAVGDKKESHDERAA